MSETLTIIAFAIIVAILGGIKIRIWWKRTPAPKRRRRLILVAIGIGITIIIAVAVRL